MRVENSFIPVEGVGEGIERSLWSAGVTEWDEFAGRGRSVPGVGPTLAERIEAFVAEARPRLRAGDARYLDRAFPGSERWRLYEEFRDEACFFDIETTGLDEYRNRVTTVSLHRGGETETLVRGRDLTADRLRTELCEAPLVVSYNGANFDVPFLEHEFDLSVDAPHLDLIHVCRRLGLTGGLSVVENRLGIDRAVPDVDGREAVRLWHRYERRGDRGALDRLVRYNREDAVNLRPVADAVVARLHRRAFDPIEDAPDPGVPYDPTGDDGPPGE